MVPFLDPFGGLGILMLRIPFRYLGTWTPRVGLKGSASMIFEAGGKRSQSVGLLREC